MLDERLDRARNGVRSRDVGAQQDAVAVEGDLLVGQRRVPRADAHQVVEQTPALASVRPSPLDPLGHVVDELVVGDGQGRRFAAQVEVRVRRGHHHRRQLYEFVPVLVRDAQERTRDDRRQALHLLAQIERGTVQGRFEEPDDRPPNAVLPGLHRPRGELGSDRPADLAVPGRVGGRQQHAGRDVVLPEMGDHRAALRGELPVVAEHAADVVVAGHRPELPAVQQHLVMQGRLRPHHVPDQVRIARCEEVQVEQIDAIEVDVPAGARFQPHVRALPSSISSAIRAGVCAR